MKQYASSFISGLQSIIKVILTKEIPDIKIHLLLDGLVVFSTKADIKKVTNLRFFNNSFFVLKRSKASNANAISQMFNSLSNDRGLNRTISSHIQPYETGKTFRLMASSENQFVSIDNNLRRKVEEQISHIKGLRVHRSKPVVEFWVLYRNEGYVFFLKRITRHTAYEKVLEKGELKPELTYILNRMSEPKKNDVFLDPFCGSGSIPLARASLFPYNMIFGTDNDKEKIKSIRNKVKESKIKGTFIAKYQDALNLESFESGFIHKIVTDPPWGIFDKLENEQEFYSQMLNELYRVLKLDGIMVILTAKKEEFEKEIAKRQSQLKLVEKHNILVSGKKAAIFKILKIA